MAQDFGDEASEKLFNDFKQFLINAIRYRKTPDRTVSSMSSENGNCIPFGTSEDAAYFAATCRKNSLDIDAYVDRKGNGFIEIPDTVNEDELEKSIRQFANIAERRKIMELSDIVRNAEPLEASVQRGLTKVTVLPDISMYRQHQRPVEKDRVPATEKPTESKARAAHGGIEQQNNKTQQICDKVREAREQYRGDFEEFKRLLAASGIQVGVTVTGEPKFIDESGWQVGADKLKRDYGLDVSNDWIKSWDSADTDKTTPVVEREGNGTDISMSEISRESQKRTDESQETEHREENACEEEISLESEARDMREAHDELYGAETPDREISHLMQPER